MRVEEVNSRRVHQGILDKDLEVINIVNMGGSTNCINPIFVDNKY